MTPKQIVNAYKAIQELSGVVLPYKVSRSIAKLKKRLAEEFDTVIGIEKALVEKHGGKAKGGSYHFDSADAAADFSKEYEEAMRQNDDSVNLPAVDLSKYADIIRISPGAVEALESIVIFEEDTDG